MISLVKREDYSSEEEYQKAYEEMLEAIRIHNEMNPNIPYDSEYKEEFLRYYLKTNN